MGLRDAILERDDLVKEPVDVPEWGTTVWVRTMTGKERDRYESDLLSNKDKPLEDRLDNVRAKLAVLTVVDADGERVFDDADVVALGNKSASALSRVVTVAQRLNALSDADVEDLAGN